MTDDEPEALEEGPSWCIQDVGEGPVFYVTDVLDDEARAAYRRSGLARLALNIGWDYQSGPLEALRGLDVEHLELLDPEVTDVSELRSLTGLRSLVLGVSSKACIDLAWFPALEWLGTGWSTVRDGLQETASLQTLRLSGYDAADLDPLEPVRDRLASLTLLNAKDLQRLSGRWPALEQLVVADARRLRRLDDLAPDAFPALEHLELEHCSAISDLAPIARLRTLRTFGCSDGGRIAGLAPLRALTDLRAVWLWGSTVVEDGDLSVLQTLPKLRDLRIADRPEYRPPVPVLHEHIGVEPA